MGLVSPWVWLIPAPDHCSMSFLLIKSFLNSLSMYCHCPVGMCVARTKCQLLVIPVCVRMKSVWWLLLESDQGCRCPCSVVSVTGVSKESLTSSH